MYIVGENSLEERLAPYTHKDEELAVRPGIEPPTLAVVFAAAAATLLFFWFPVILLIWWIA